MAISVSELLEDAQLLEQDFAEVEDLASDKAATVSQHFSETIDGVAIAGTVTITFTPDAKAA
jgi:hypothetical protein